jgi:uncharacterized protein DUF7033
MPPALIVHHPPGYPAEREYAARVMLDEFLGLEIALELHQRTDVEISLADDDGRRLVLRDGLFATPEHDWLTAASLPTVTWWGTGTTPVEAKLVSPSLPVLYGEPHIEVGDTAITLGPDLLGGAFFMLTRYEELCVDTRDEHERFPAAASVTAGLLDRPIVNEYVEVLWWALSRLWPRLERRRREFRVVPSHDVDWPLARWSAKTLAGDILKRREPDLALRRLLRRDRLNDTFDWIMGESERRGLRSAFYFIAGHTAGEIDGTYELEDPFVRRLLRRIHERGHEVGFHPSYGTFRDPEATRREFERLVAVCEAEGVAQDAWGGRQHFLRWENPTTWRNWDAAGLAYDSTLSFREEPGFRCGVCYEYPVFDLRARRQFRLRERPLVVMEVSATGLGPRPPDGTSRRIAALRERCRLFNGDFTLLWHNDRLIARAQRRLYTEALGA